MSRPCPFCDTESDELACPACHRMKSSPRRICSQCGGMTPKSEPSCCRCAKIFTPELRWKVPLIIGIFLLAFVIAIFIEIVSN